MINLILGGREGGLILGGGHYSVVRYWNPRVRYMEPSQPPCVWEGLSDVNSKP